MEAHYECWQRLVVSSGASGEPPTKMVSALPTTRTLRVKCLIMILVKLKDSHNPHPSTPGTHEQTQDYGSHGFPIIPFSNGMVMYKLYKDDDDGV